MKLCVYFPTVFFIVMSIIAFTTLPDHVADLCCGILFIVCAIGQVVNLRIYQKWLRMP